MKRVLITAGPVYGPLDDNKLVGNRVRGIWAGNLAEYLSDHGHTVTLLLPDLMADPRSLEGRYGPRFKGLAQHDIIHVAPHRGYWDYAAQCYELAKSHDAAVMAAAVVNWIPANPIKGKMETKGYAEGDIIDIPFILAPRVINRMRGINPRLTLIGCKMLIDKSDEDLIEAAYNVLLTARCNAVLANDMGQGLRRKLLVHQDRTVVEYADRFLDLFVALREIIEDEHYRTEPATAVFHTDPVEGAHYRRIFDEVVAKYRGRFTHRQTGSDRVFGAVAVRVGDLLDPSSHEEYLVSPREKGEMFSSADAVTVVDVRDRRVLTEGGKATLNAPLLVRVLRQFPEVKVVLHLHEQLPGAPTVPYAPPGTVRDSERDIPGRVFNIEGHGFIACLGDDLEIP